MLRAVIFDFDGVILDTETYEYRTWCEVYDAHSQVLPLELWVLGVGRRGGFDPYEHLELLLDAKVDRDAVRADRRQRYEEIRPQVRLMDGVGQLVTGLRAAGVKLGIASSSDDEWVLGHLAPHPIASMFDAIVCASDEGLPAKPDPAVYLAALERLGVAAPDALAIEDSPNGIAAAKSAGLYCIAVPNDITAALDFSAADQVVSSLAHVSIPALVAAWEP